MMPSDLTHSPATSRLQKGLPGIAVVTCLAIILGLLANSLSQQRSQVRLLFDRQNLHQMLLNVDYNNDLLQDTVLISATNTQNKFVSQELLGLKQDRLAYIARQGDEVVAIIVPATAEDGFNGHVDLLIAVNMLGRIVAARVIRDLPSNELVGIVDIIESKWMKEFDGNSMRDILRISWQKIEADQEYDQFVGASVTPRTVSDRIYDALVFVQSNRIRLMGAEG
jgi:electron transport complex protein RnfG